METGDPDEGFVDVRIARTVSKDDTIIHAEYNKNGNVSCFQEKRKIY